MGQRNIDGLVRGRRWIGSLQGNDVLRATSARPAHGGPMGRTQLRRQDRDRMGRNGSQRRRGPRRHWAAKGTGYSIMTDEVCEVVITGPDADWLADFTRRLVESRLAACG